MAFTRTASGLNNQHLFYNVDFIVFVEGGQSFTKQEIDQGHFNEMSIDIIFWTAIFNTYKPAKYKFKAVGSKSAVKKVAEDIINNNLTTVFTAMDQEFDMVLSSNLIHPNIKYTYGYSWENDIWNEEVICDIISRLSAINTQKGTISPHINRFLRDIKFSVYSDAYLFSKGLSYFPRPGHMRLFLVNPALAPELNRSELTLLKNTLPVSKSTIYSYGSKKSIQVRRNCYGHLFGDYCKNLVKFLLRTLYNLNGISDEIIRRLALSNYIVHFSDEIRNYYQTSLQ
ncbi:DUF4435 domain-containing protein [Flavobacterium sp. J27]|uniref:DUF4435 domain-containing protein n=1 Tax=Flavobacterium sp. J27 TaxID=2060419 RepID=UPI001031E9E8|nr:DUF4435 domain-containing protein [Flavobacterium sp. J27]